MNNEIQNTRDLLRSLSEQDFLEVGMNEIAYIRPVQTDAVQKIYHICAADGSKLSVVNTMDRAVAAIYNNDMHLVTLH